MKRYPPGTILDIPETVGFDFPQAGLDISAYVAGIQAELRAIGSALAMPEYMISGDSSNANYASTMVAEGPAVKTFEEMQAELIDADLVVMRLALKVAAAAGRLPDNVAELVEVDAEPPLDPEREPAARDQGRSNPAGKPGHVARHVRRPPRLGVRNRAGQDRDGGEEEEG